MRHYKKKSWGMGLGFLAHCPGLSGQMLTLKRATRNWWEVLKLSTFPFPPINSFIIPLIPSPISRFRVLFPLKPHFSHSSLTFILLLHNHTRAPKHLSPYSCIIIWVSSLFLPFFPLTFCWNFNYERGGVPNWFLQFYKSLLLYYIMEEITL